MAVAATESAVPTRAGHRRSADLSLGARLLSYLPRGNLLDDVAWKRRHKIVQGLLLLHLPGLALFGLWMQQPPISVALALVPIAICLVLGALIPQRRWASFFTTAGIVYSSSALVGLSNGLIEAHFHFFIIIGFIALYQDWVPFLFNILFTVLSHGLGSAFQRTLMFNHPGGIEHPWEWSLVHGVAVLAGCIGVVLFWRTNEDEQQKSLALTRELSEAEILRRRFTSDLLVNLARRNQSMLYRQLDIINQLEEQERDPDALAELFKLDHLATRIRRNAESLLVLSGEEPPRVWSKPVRLVDVVRAAIAETEDLNRVVFVVDERLSVLGHAVTDLTHLLAELTENAVRSSPPESRVTIRSTPGGSADARSLGPVVITVEDWGVGMRPEDLTSANAILAEPVDVDIVVSRRLGLHVVSRLAHRHSINVSLTSTSGAGITAVILLPPDLFAPTQPTPTESLSGSLGWSPPRTEPRNTQRWQPMTQPAMAIDVSDSAQIWDGWWESDAGRSRFRQPEIGTLAPDAALTRYEVPEYEVPSYDVISASAGTPPARRNGLSVEGHGRRNGASNGVARSGYPSENAYGAPEITAEEASPPVRLNRRTPQANLAPELRRGAQPDTPSQAPQVPPPDAARARDALSRYQASRQAALSESDVVEEGPS